MEDGSQHPAAAIVLEAEDGLGEALFENRAAQAPHANPATGKRPLRPDSHVFEQIARITVVEIEHPRESGLITHPGVEALRQVFAGVVLPERFELHPAGEMHIGLAKDIGAPVDDGALVGHEHLRRLEIIALTQREPQAFPAGVRFQETGGRRHRDLVGIGDAVVAHVAVRIENLGKTVAEARRVEERDVILAAIGGFHVVDARLQGLEPVTTEEARVALEGEPHVERGDRNAAIDGRAPPRQGRLIQVIARVVPLQARFEMPPATIYG